jgi:hypothetical protein
VPAAFLDAEDGLTGLLLLGVWVPILPGVIVGILVGRLAPDPRRALLAELGVVGLLCLAAGAAWSAGYALWVGVWLLLGAQLGAWAGRRRPSRARRPLRVTRVYERPATRWR